MLLFLIITTLQHPSFLLTFPLIYSNLFKVMIYFITSWRVVRVVDRAALEMPCLVRGRGFESHTLRHKGQRALLFVLLFCIESWGSNPRGHRRQMRGAGDASNSRWFKPTEWRGAERQICESKSV